MPTKPAVLVAGINVQTKVLIKHKILKHLNTPVATHSPHKDATQRPTIGTETVNLILAGSKAQ